MTINNTTPSTQPETTAVAATPSEIGAAPLQSSSKSLVTRYLQDAGQFTSFGDYEPVDFSDVNTGDGIDLDQPQFKGVTRFAQAIGTGALHRTTLFPLESITTRLMLGEAPKGSYFRGLGTCIATGAVGKATSMSSNKAIGDSLESNNIEGASLIAGVAAGAVETALNPISVIGQHAKLLPANEVLPALKKIPLKGYYNGGAAMVSQNLITAGFWYCGNATIRNKEDSLAVEAGKSAAVAAVGSTLTWPLYLVYIQRIGVNGVSPTYREIVQNAIKAGAVKGLRLSAFFPSGILRVIISGAILGPLINRFNEK